MTSYHHQQQSGYNGHAEAEQYSRYYNAASLTPTDIPSHDNNEDGDDGGADADVASICAASLRQSYTDTDDVGMSPISPTCPANSDNNIADAYNSATGKVYPPYGNTAFSGSSDTHFAGGSGHRHTYSICSRRNYYASPSLPPPAITITADSDAASTSSDYMAGDASPPLSNNKRGDKLMNALPCAPVSSTATGYSVASSHTYNNTHEIIEMQNSQNTSRSRMRTGSVDPSQHPSRPFHHDTASVDLEKSKRAKEPRKTVLHTILYNRDGLYRPLFMLTMITLQVIGLAVELAVNCNLTGSVIAMGDQFNYLIGPSTYTWIRTGARFTPCIKSTVYLGQSIQVPGAPGVLPLSDLCGMGGFPSGQPNQWFRLLLPIFLHGGVLHLLLNGLFQCHTGVQMEREWGGHRIAPIYLLGGIGGFLLGATVAPPQMVSLGASGAIFALVAACLIELLQRWNETAQRKRQLAQMLLMIIISLAIGLLPGIDNFAHIGGFLLGLLAGMAFLPQAAGRFWVVGRWVAAALLIAVFAAFFLAFYLTTDSASICPWCRYLSCLPINGWCDALAPPTPVSQ